MSGEKLYVDLPPFTGRNVPVTEIAKAMHKDAQYVRVGLQQGILRFGYAITNPTSTTTTAPTGKFGKRSVIFNPRQYEKSPHLAG